MSSLPEPVTAGGEDHAVTGVPRPWFAVAVAVLAQTLVLLDNTILNIALDTLADPVRGLGASSAELAWAVASYSLVFAAGGFAGGALADRYGPRRVLIGGLLVLAGSATVAAFSVNATELIVTRAFMGAGGALITPATLAVVSRHPPAAARTRAIAIWASSGGVAVALGPVAGGLLLSHFHWGAIFLLNLPVAAVCLAGVVKLVPELLYAGRRVLDPAGLALSMLGMGSLVYGIIEGGGRPGWTSPLTIVPVLAGVALLVTFVLVQRGRERPGFDVRLFAAPRFSGGTVALLLLFFGLAGQLFYCAFYLQGVRGLSPLAAGAVMTAAAGGIVTGNQLSPAVCKLLTVRWATVAGICVAAATFGAYLFFGPGTPVAWIVLMLLVQGAGIGAVVAPMTAEMMAALPAGHTGAGAAINAATRPVGSTLGVAVLGSILAAGYRTAILPALADLPPSARDRVLDSAESARSVAVALGRPGLAAAANDAYLHAMSVAAIWTLGLSLAGVLPVIACFRPRK